jgi:Transposase DDE domain
MFRDEPRRIVWEKIRQSDLQAFVAILPPEVFVQAAAQAGVSLGRGALNLATLAWLSLSAAMRPGINFCRVLTLTFRLLSEVGRLPLVPAESQPRDKKSSKKSSKHDPRVAADRCPSEEAFVQARGLMPQAYWVALILILGQLFEARHRDLLLWNGLRLLVLDGTCITLPRWKALGEHFDYARNRRGTPRPQARMVMLLLANVRLPWRYELTPRSQGESSIAARLLEELRPDDLVLMDRGFFNYGLFAQVQEAGGFFAIRRIKGLRCRTIRRISSGERIVLWTPANRKWKGAEIQLRVIDYQVKGFRKSAIVTNLLDEKRFATAQILGLSDSQAWTTERDCGLYHQRWQIETAFRELKRVQRMQGTLRGRTPQAIQYEVAGHVLLYLLVRWLIVEAAKEHGAEPLRLSFTEALAEVQHVSTILLVCQPCVQQMLLATMLQKIAGHRVPLRPGRHYPRPNDFKRRRTGPGYKLTGAKLRSGKT